MLRGFVFTVCGENTWGSLLSQEVKREWESIRVNIMEIKCNDFARSDLQYKFTSSAGRHHPPVLQFAVTAINSNPTI